MGDDFAAGEGEEEKSADGGEQNQRTAEKDSQPRENRAGHLTHLRIEGEHLRLRSDSAGTSIRLPLPVQLLLQEHVTI